MSEENLKLCIDCFFHERTNTLDDLCKRKMHRRTSLITGREEIVGEFFYCIDERYNEDKCGESAIFFKPKQLENFTPEPGE